MKYYEMTKNFVFREFECGLTVEETAKLCFKSVRQVKEWDKGKVIPSECKRLMRMSKGRELSSCASWEAFKMRYDKLELPTGKLVTAQEILAGVALLEIAAPDDLKINTKLLKYARAISEIKKSR
ncbi:TPA: regulator [Vibrio vulnificus]|uniref:phage protein n=1 Tax=Vibrio vulnificus TaxID=672 RepID=UPI00102C302B|nr:phage protein [Vibrio vulnificus]EGR0109208.1 regulator [Vibrio vulnificus]ELV8584700.1 phage protein [Vibrio vulnificus]ELV8668948.1 phage protein [Vibrio vulnificus]ELV8706415.1 phage protein [Vibrio vulnificus]ELV8808894.1 phage protein [Vibrio vulnificus]